MENKQKWHSRATHEKHKPDTTQQLHENSTARPSRISERMYTRHIAQPDTLYNPYRTHLVLSSHLNFQHSPKHYCTIAINTLLQCTRGNIRLLKNSPRTDRCGRTANRRSSTARTSSAPARQGPSVDGPTSPRSHCYPQAAVCATPS